jgi:hypothetical protein
VITGNILPGVDGVPSRTAAISAPPPGTSPSPVMPLTARDRKGSRSAPGPDDAAFCRRVSEAIALGYRLHEGPAVTFNGEQVIVAQALLWPGAGDVSQG